MPRNIIRLAGSSYLRIKSLTGDNVLQDREVVIAKDTNELYLGKSDGTFDIITNLQIGQTINDINSIDPLRGRFFFNEDRGTLYVGNGTGWKRVGTENGSSSNITPGSGLDLNEETGELSLKVDNQSIIFDGNGNLTVNNTDYGEF